MILSHLRALLVFTLIFTTNCDKLFSEVRGSSAPFITGDTFRAYADHVFDETTPFFNPKKVKSGDVVFVKTDWDHLGRFFALYHPQISFQYILVTHNSDYGIPGPYARYLDDPKLLGWFAQNVEDFSHPKLHPIPIGIANKCWDHGNPNTFLASLPLSKNRDRPILCYLNFQAANYPKERNGVKDSFSKHSWCVTSNPKALQNYLQDLSSSKFVLSPRGNGLDCHRTWEALLMGAIPIVRTSTLDPLYHDLPVLIVSSWDTVTETYLEEQYEIMKLKKFDLEKVYIDYWIHKIRTHRSF